MFDNIGEKISGVGKVICTIGISISVLTGVYIMCLGDENVLLGFLTMVIGPLLFWLSCLTLVGFGELITRVVCIEEKVRRIRLDNYDMKKKDPVCVPPKYNVNYNCERIYVGHPAGVGSCQECGREGVALSYCEIKTELGIKERSLCDCCIDGYRNNSTGVSQNGNSVDVYINKNDPQSNKYKCIDFLKGDLVGAGYCQKCGTATQKLYYGKITAESGVAEYRVCKACCENFIKNMQD